MQKTKNSKIKVLTECALLVALATVLSFVSVIKLPFGGDITAFSMLPLIILSYRHGIVKGMICGFVYSLLQLLFGLANLQFATSFLAVVAIILFDYVLAYMATAAGGLFTKSKLSQPTAMVFAVIIACAVRLLCHFVSGCTVWASYAADWGMPVMQYSIAYNAAYMVPECLITSAVGLWIANLVNFKSENLSFIKKEETTPKCVIVFNSISLLSIVVAVIVDIMHLLFTVQSEEGIDFSRISYVNLTFVLIVLVVGVLLFAIFKLLAISKSSKKD